MRPRSSLQSSFWLGLALWGCSPQGADTGGDDVEESDSSVMVDSDSIDSGTVLDTASDTGLEPDPDDEPCDPPDYGEPGDPFADAVVRFEPGEGHGFGKDEFPDIVLGPPRGKGPDAGSLDVLSLGESGEIILELLDRAIVDGEGPDLLIFENPFPGWVEPGEVAISEDGETWYTWPCDTDSSDYAGCAGLNPVLSHPDNCIDATDPELAGGDAFDLAALGIERARYIRIRDAGVSGPGGFDLDAIAVVNGDRFEH